jgi:hypothetical protein
MAHGILAFGLRVKIAHGGHAGGIIKNNSGTFAQFKRGAELSRLGFPHPGLG